MLTETQIQLKEWVNENALPKVVRQTLQETLTQIESLSENMLSYADEQQIKHHINSNILSLITAYLNIPKSQAVSMIVENNKTAKDILITNITLITNDIYQIIDNAIKHQTKQLTQINTTTVITPQKIDFFDM